MNNCVFCKIVNGDILSFELYNDLTFKVILDTKPVSKGHCLIIPKKHYENVLDISDDVLKDAFILSKIVGKKMIDILGATGFNIIQNNGIDAGQTVLHFHIHVIPRYENDGLNFNWKEYKLSDLDKKLILRLFKL